MSCPLFSSLIFLFSLPVPCTASSAPLCGPVSLICTLQRAVVPALLSLLPCLYLLLITLSPDPESSPHLSSISNLSFCFARVHIHGFAMPNCSVFLMLFRPVLCTPYIYTRLLPPFVTRLSILLVAISTGSMVPSRHPCFPLY
ncbi:hypothetical protein IF1G_03275 [Cordyceps javanica]|uniref:Uncharacterized protein n=1 Tax=Cordyceps javanica TaxID=43265 RepID=A0A545V738_9HYPO|nr:hypothetical protein IF1G_03275 [Cordyceps javanica]